MRLKRMIQRCAFLVLVVLIIAALPLTASAQESGEGDSARYLSRVYNETDHGKPESGTTRAQYIQILYRAAGTPEVTGTTLFVDVAPDAEYASALVWAERTGVARSDRAKTFDPDGLITEEDAADFLRSALSALGSSAKKVANSILAAYTGRVQEEDYALTPDALLAVLDRITAEDAAEDTQPMSDYDLHFHGDISYAS